MYDFYSIFIDFLSKHYILIWIFTVFGGAGAGVGAQALTAKFSSAFRSMTTVAKKGEFIFELVVLIIFLVFFAPIMLILQPAVIMDNIHGILAIIGLIVAFLIGFIPEYVPAIEREINKLAVKIPLSFIMAMFLIVTIVLIWTLSR